MSDVFTISFLTSVLAAATLSGVAILYAALGEVLAERAGVLNLGVEGMMVMGALGGFAVCSWTGSAELGLLGAMVVGGAMALIHAVLTVTFLANQVVCGLALTIFGGGLSGFLGSSLVGKPAKDRFSKIDIPVLGDFPGIGNILFNQNVLVYAAYVIVPAMWWFVYRTRPGLNLRAVGESPATADAMGLNIARTRYIYVVIGGVFSGIGGAAISLATNPGWAENMTAGRGWIAVALVIFGAWNPVRVALGAFLFGAVEAGQFRLQGINIPVSAFFLNMLPYIFTIAVLVFSTVRSRNKRIGQPASLGKPYVREER